MNEKTSVGVEWQLVPKVPSDEQRFMGADAYARAIEKRQAVAPAVYAAMLAAAIAGDALERLAREVHIGRFPEGQEVRPAFENESREGKEYCRRIARRVLSTSPQAAPSSSPSLTEEPVAWRFRVHGGEWFVSCKEEPLRKEGYDVEPLYAHPAPVRSDEGWQDEQTKFVVDFKGVQGQQWRSGVDFEIEDYALDYASGYVAEDNPRFATVSKIETRRRETVVASYPSPPKTGEPV